jgi:transposase
MAVQKKSTRAAEQDRPDVAERRAFWQACQDDVDPTRLVFLDETGLKTDMARPRGWAPAGQRLVDKTPGGCWQTYTLVQAISLEETRAALVLDGPIDSHSFTAFCQELLAPQLREGDLVILDNLSSHKSASARGALEAVGAEVIDLPPYSPDLNPIEGLFAKVKAIIRGLRPETSSTIVDAVHDALQRLTADDIENAFAHCGYAAMRLRKIENCSSTSVVGKVPIRGISVLPVVFGPSSVASAASCRSRLGQRVVRAGCNMDNRSFT